jgi:hypothetical protein
LFTFIGLLYIFILKIRRKRIMKKVTIEDIMNWEPCRRYPRERIKKLMGRKKYVTLDDIWKTKLDNKADYLWLVFREEFISDSNLHKIAIYAAELALPIFEERHPDDKRPRQAIEAKKKWLRGKISDKELKDASDAAWATSYAARAAAWAASYNASYAARDAARDAIWVAADNNIYNKIIKYIKRITK